MKGLIKYYIKFENWFNRTFYSFLVNPRKIEEYERNASE